MKIDDIDLIELMMAPFDKGSAVDDALKRVKAKLKADEQGELRRLCSCECLFIGCAMTGVNCDTNGESVCDIVRANQPGKNPEKEPEQNGGEG